jgi:phosphoadenosine phosphosulfate reductase
MSGMAPVGELRPAEDWPAQDWEELGREWEHTPPEQILRAAADWFAPGRLAVASAFGPGSLVLIDLLSRCGLHLPVIFIDTLYHFPQTLEHVARVRERYDLDLRICRPAESREAFEARYGPNLWERDVDRYHWLSKVEPFRLATAELDGWLTGRRREQADTRTTLPVVEVGDRIRINPLASWSGEAVWRYLREHDVPYNALHDGGYTSIGDEPLTTPVGPGEHERAGRWRGLDKTECGIHASW